MNIEGRLYEGSASDIVERLKDILGYRAPPVYGSVLADVNSRRAEISKAERLKTQARYGVAAGSEPPPSDCSDDGNLKYNLSTVGSTANMKVHMRVHDGVLIYSKQQVSPRSANTRTLIYSLGVMDTNEVEDVSLLSDTNLRILDRWGVDTSNISELYGIITKHPGDVMSLTQCVVVGYNDRKSFVIPMQQGETLINHANLEEFGFIPINKS